MSKKELTPTERKKLQDVLSGRSDPNSKAAQAFLNRPHVAVAFEDILDSNGLSDMEMTKKISEIVNREGIESINAKTGTLSTNQTAVDANALNAIRTIWQIKGKFIDRKEIGVKGSLSGMSEEQLDKIIANGGELITGHKVAVNKGHGDR